MSEETLMGCANLRSRKARQKMRASFCLETSKHQEILSEFSSTMWELVNHYSQLQRNRIFLRMRKREGRRERGRKDRGEDER